jgi:hypothetical protein
MPRWLSAEETSRRVKELGNPHGLMAAYGLALFARRGFRTPAFRLDERWGQAIVLTAEGEECLRWLQTKALHFSDALCRFLLFGLFYHTELLVDFEKTDTGLVLDLLGDLHASRGMVWPYVFGNTLYHKFNDTYEGNRTDYLDAATVESLLDDTPQGVFQVGTLVSGPLGFLQSAEERVFPPTLSVVLWHCSDPGCRHMHVVQLRQPDDDVKHAGDAVVRLIEDSFGPRSEWDWPILWIYREGKWPNGRPFYDIPAVLADCIIGEERQHLLYRALKSPYNGVIVEALRRQRGLQGSPEILVATTSPAEQHQLLLLLRDDDLIAQVDESIARREIRIPASELRSARTYRPGHSSDCPSRLSCLGIRTSSHPAPLELGATLWNTYNELGDLRELEWRVRNHAGETLRHRLFEYIRVEGPAAVVRDLVLSSRAVTRAVSRQMRFSLRDGEDQTITVQRLLWKFGFSLPRYDEDCAVLRERLTEFTACALGLPKGPTEEDRARVRGIGVNLFVSVERFLEDVIAYNAWMMTSDHFLGTRFSYSRQAALKLVPTTLGTRVTSGDAAFEWKADGTNTLGCLLAYLEAFRSWLAARKNADPTSLARDVNDYPHYSRDTLRVFPFKHTALWADCDSEALAAYVEIIDKICTQLAQAELAAARNGLDHKRDEEAFPDADRLVACAARLQQAVDAADERRILPKLFWGVHSEAWDDGNLCDTFEDYRGSAVSLWGTPCSSGIPLRHLAIPYLIAPVDFLRQPGSLLVFGVAADTPYREYWRDYPRRRFIPSSSIASPQSEESVDAAGESPCP